MTKQIEVLSKVDYAAIQKRYDSFFKGGTMVVGITATKSRSIEIHLRQAVGEKEASVIMGVNKFNSLFAI
jgi:hypothetical protein